MARDHRSSINIQFTWTDQGWGSCCRGSVLVRVTRGRSGSEQILPGPWGSVPRPATAVNHDFADVAIEPGDVVDVVYSCCGNGHTMTVTSLMIAFGDPPSPTPPSPPQSPPMPPLAPPTPPMPPLPPLLPGSHLVLSTQELRGRLPSCVLCTDTCTEASDGNCDDGGLGYEYSSCPLGTDCADCGARLACTGVGTVHVLLVEGRTYTLNGIQLEIPAGVIVRISSAGSGATIDAEGLTRFFRIFGELHLENVRLVNGAVIDDPIGGVGDLGVVYGDYHAGAWISWKDMAAGGAMVLESGAIATLTHVHIQGVNVHSSSQYCHGGVFLLQAGAAATFTHTTIQDITVSHGALPLYAHMAGGIFYLAFNATVTLDHVVIERVAIQAHGHQYGTLGGAMYIEVQGSRESEAARFTHVTIQDISTRDNSGWSAVRARLLEPSRNIRPEC